MSLPWLTEDERFIQETAQRFARERLAEGYLARSKEECIDRGLMRELGQLGLIAPTLDERYGGIGSSSVVAGLICEALAYADINVSYVPMIAPLVGGVIQQHGSEAMKDEVLPQLAGGEIMIQLGLTEPRGGSDAANLALRATPRGDRFVLNGEKTSITYGAQAEMMLLFARTDADTPGARGVTAFLVPLDLPGVTCTRFEARCSSMMSSCPTRQWSAIWERDSPR